jgi:hypothetical protein
LAVRDLGAGDRDDAVDGGATPVDVDGTPLRPGDTVELVSETIPQYPGLLLVKAILDGRRVRVVPLPTDVYDFDGARLRRYDGEVE